MNRLLFAGIGILVGVLAAAIWWRPKTALRLAAFAAGGCMIAAAASWLLPNRYVSFATLRIIPAIAPKGWYARHQFEPVDRLRHLEFVALGLPSLQEIIQRPSLDLYRDERTRRPIADVAAAMRKGDIRTEVVPPGYFKIWFSYGDRFKAQAVVREFVTRFIEANVTEERERTKREGPEFKTMADHKLGENLEVLDPATLPEEPIWPDRLRIALAGLGAGLLLGIVTLWLRRPRDPAPEAAVPSVA